MKRILLFILLSCSFDIAGQCQDADFYTTIDEAFSSGSIVWSVTQEIYHASSVPTENNMPGLSNEDFIQWKERSAHYRLQNFRLACMFNDENLHFLVEGEPGEIIPVSLNQELSYNGVNFTFFDHTQQNYFRKPSLTTFRESYFALSFISPRICGYGLNELKNTIRNIRDINNQSPAIQFIQVPDKLSFIGQFPGGLITLAELVPDSVYPQVFRTIKYINPTFGERIVVTNNRLRAYSGNVVFPEETVVDRYLGGTLEAVTNSPHLDRTTLTVVSAEFLMDIPLTLFNQPCPVGYTDLNN